MESEPTQETVLPEALRATAAQVTLPALPKDIFVIQHAVRTHTGLVRDHNEDDYLTSEAMGVYLVADGMGGHAAGKVASRICVDTVERYFEQSIGSSDDAPDGLSWTAAQLESSLRHANRAIFDASSADSSLHGMGTTAVGIRIAGEHVAICHAGDSRCYLLRDGRFRQVTVDHSLSNFLLSMGRDMEARLAEATMSNVIMRALGLEPDVVIDTQEFRIRLQDRLLLCSDGLSDLVPFARLERMMQDTSLTRDSLAESLVQAALDAGGRDNITAIIVDITARLDGSTDDDPALDDTADDTTARDTDQIVLP
jgi:protein phosphatase